MKNIYRDLDKFVEEFAGSDFGGRANLHIDGFEDLYVRIARHNIGGAYCRTLDIARVGVAEERKGTFTRFLSHCEKLAVKHRIGVYVECVQNPHLEGFLLKRGYVSDGAPFAPSLGKSLAGLERVNKVGATDPEP